MSDTNTSAPLSEHLYKCERLSGDHSPFS